LTMRLAGPYPRRASLEAGGHGEEDLGGLEGTDALIWAATRNDGPMADLLLRAASPRTKVPTVSPLLRRTKPFIGNPFPRRTGLFVADRPIRPADLLRTAPP
jgi:hypothetical protein